MSTISAGTATGTALVSTGDTTGQLVLQTNGTTTAVTIGTNQVVTLAQPLPVGSGGTGATSLTANNVILGNGTSAVNFVAPGTNGNVLTSNGTTWVSQAASPSGLTLLSTVTASSSSTVNIETGIGSSYDFYMIAASNITMTSGGILTVRLRLSGSYATSGYYAMSNGGYANGSGNLAYNQNGESFFYVTVTGYTSAGSAAAGEFWFSNPTNTSSRKVCNWVFGFSDGSGAHATLQGTGANSDTGALTGVQFFPSNSSNITTGTFRLYGYSK